jgi:hypothetical protein
VLQVTQEQVMAQAVVEVALDTTQVVLLVQVHLVLSMY